MANPIKPTLSQVLQFCTAAPVERVFLEELAREGLGRFEAVEERGRLRALCHFGANIAPSGHGCAVFAEATAASDARMIIGEERAVGELWGRARSLCPTPREVRPGQPVYATEEPPEAGGTGLREARPRDFELLVPACAAAHAEELGTDSLEGEADAFRLRVWRQIDEGRSWLWLDGGTILFKAEASAWTRQAVQLQQVWVDPPARNCGYGQRGMRDLLRLLLHRTPVVCLFVRRENAAAIRVYEAVGMRRVLTYRSILL